MRSRATAAKNRLPTCRWSSNLHQSRPGTQEQRHPQLRWKCPLLGQKPTSERGSPRLDYIEVMSKTDGAAALAISSRRSAGCRLSRMMRSMYCSGASPVLAAASRISLVNLFSEPFLRPPVLIAPGHRYLFLYFRESLQAVGHEADVFQLLLVRHLAPFG